PGGHYPGSAGLATPASLARHAGPVGVGAPPTDDAGPPASSYRRVCGPHGQGSLQPGARTLPTGSRLSVAVHHLVGAVAVLEGSPGAGEGTRVGRRAFRSCPARE